MDNSATEKLLYEFRQAANGDSLEKGADKATAGLNSLLDAAARDRAGSEGPAEAGQSATAETAFSSIAASVLGTLHGGTSSKTGGAWSAGVESAFSSVAAGVVSSLDSDSGGGGVTSALKSVLKAGFGLAPLITSLFGLFGGGDSAESAPKLLKYVMPQSMDIERAADDWGLSSVDYDQMGMPRAYGGASRSADGGGTNRALETSERNPGTQQITVNVQAMDARSFLDRSADIAAAVRNAMLNLNSVNDVVSDL